MAKPQFSKSSQRVAVLLATFALAACNGGGGGGTKGTATKVNPRTSNNRNLPVQDRQGAGDNGVNKMANQDSAQDSGQVKTAATSEDQKTQVSGGTGAAATQKVQPTVVPKELIARHATEKGKAAAAGSAKSSADQVVDVTDKIQRAQTNVATQQTATQTSTARAESGVPLTAPQAQAAPASNSSRTVEDLFREAGIAPRGETGAFAQSGSGSSSSETSATAAPVSENREARQANSGDPALSGWPRNQQPGTQPNLTGGAANIQDQVRYYVDAAYDSVMAALTSAVDQMSAENQEGSHQLAALIDEVQVQAQAGLIGAELVLETAEKNMRLRFQGAFSRDGRVANLQLVKSSSQELDLRVKAFCVDQTIRQGVCQIVVLRVDQWINKICRRTFVVNRSYNEGVGQANLVMSNEADYNFWINYESKDWSEVEKAYPSASQRAFLRMFANTVYNNKIKNGELKGAYRKPYFRFADLATHSSPYSRSRMSLILEKTNGGNGSERELGPRTRIMGDLATSIYNEATTDRRLTDQIMAVETIIFGNNQIQSDEKFNDNFRSGGGLDSVDVAKLLFTDGQGKLTVRLKFDQRRLGPKRADVDMKPEFQFNVVNLSAPTLSFEQIQGLISKD